MPGPKCGLWSGAAATEEFAEIVAEWPATYAPLPTDLSDLSTPVLITNGGLDLQTPSVWARDLASALGTTAVEFPFAGHGTDITLAMLTEHGADCSLAIRQAFIEDPGAPIDTSCAATAYSPDVAGSEALTREIASWLFGTDVLYR